MRLFRCCTLAMLLVAGCGALPVAADGKPPQEYDTLVSATGDFPPIVWLNYWNAAFVGYGGAYDDAFAIAKDAAARAGWETKEILPKPPKQPVAGPLYVVLIIHTALPWGDPPPINGPMDE